MSAVPRREGGRKKGAVAKRTLHPDLWDYVVHLTGRPGKHAAEEAKPLVALTPEERLTRVLKEERILGFCQFGGSDPMVCFTESTQAGLDHLISDRDFAPWGIVFRKETIWSRGGGPVWYARPDQWDELPDSLKSWAVRTEPGKAEWLHEREWRVPATGAPPSFRFEQSEVHAVICDRVGWPEGPADQDGDPTTPPWAAGIQRWYWRQSEKRLWEFAHFQRERTLTRKDRT